MKPDEMLGTIAPEPAFTMPKSTAPSPAPIAIADAQKQVTNEGASVLPAQAAEMTVGVSHISNDQHNLFGEGRNPFPPTLSTPTPPPPTVNPGYVAPPPKKPSGSRVKL